jgi:hypothetical protein
MQKAWKTCDVLPLQAKLQSAHSSCQSQSNKIQDVNPSNLLLTPLMALAGISNIGSKFF